MASVNSEDSIDWQSLMSSIDDGNPPPPPSPPEVKFTPKVKTEQTEDFEEDEDHHDDDPEDPTQDMDKFLRMPMVTKSEKNDENNDDEQQNDPDVDLDPEHDPLGDNDEDDDDSDSYRPGYSYKRRRKSKRIKKQHKAAPKKQPTKKAVTSTSTPSMKTGPPRQRRKKRVSEMTPEEVEHMRKLWREQRARRRQKEQSKPKTQPPKQEVSSTSDLTSGDHPPPSRTKIGPAGQRRRKRVSEMTPEEYAIARAQWQLQKERRRQRLGLGEKKFSRRPKGQPMTPEEIQEKKQRRSLRRLERLANMTDEEKRIYDFQKMVRNEERKMRQRQKVAKMTPEERTARREKFKRYYYEVMADREKKQRYRAQLRQYAQRRRDERRAILSEGMGQYKPRTRSKVTRRRSRVNPNETPEERQQRQKETKLQRDRSRRLKQKLEMKKLLDSGMSMEEVVFKFETPEERKRKLILARVNQAKRQVRKSLLKTGAPPEVIEARVEQVAREYQPTENFRPFKLRVPLPSESEVGGTLDENKDNVTTVKNKNVTKMKKSPSAIIGVATTALPPASTSTPTATSASTASTSGTTGWNSIEFFNNYPCQHPFPTPTFPSQFHYHHDFSSSSMTSSYYDDNDHGGYHDFSSAASPNPDPMTPTTPATLPTPTVPDCPIFNFDLPGGGVGADLNLPKRKKEPKSQAQKAKTKRRALSGTRSKGQMKSSKNSGGGGGPTVEDDPRLFIVCDQCGNSYKKGYLPDHKRYYHNPAFQNGTCLLCNDPTKTFKNGPEFHKHFTYTHGHLHQKSKSSTESGETPNQEKPHMCEECGQSYKDAGNLRRHFYFMHGEGLKEENRFRCEFCPKSFKMDTTYQRHLKLFHPDNSLAASLRLHVCGPCGQKFGTPEELVGHLKVHHPENCHPCGFCSSVWFTKAGLLWHYSICAKTPQETRKEFERSMTSSSGENDTPVMLLRSVKIRCEFCERPQIIHGMARHYLEMHNVREDGGFSCYKEGCTKFFKVREHWVAHLYDFHGEGWTDEFQDRIRKMSVKNRDKVEVVNKEGKLKAVPGNTPRKQWYAEEAKKKKLEREKAKLERARVKKEAAKARVPKKRGRKPKKRMEAELKEKSDDDDNDDENTTTMTTRARRRQKIEDDDVNEDDEVVVKEEVEVEVEVPFEEFVDDNEEDSY